MLRSRACSSHRSAGWLCPGRTYGALGHAHPVGALTRCALIGCRVRSRSPALPQHALAVDAARGERDRADFDIQFLLQWHHDLFGGAAEAQHVGLRSPLIYALRIREMLYYGKADLLFLEAGSLL